MFQQFFAQRAAKPQDSSLKDVLVTDPHTISFAGGLPDEKAFDMERISDICARIAADRSSWQYVETEGYAPLRETLARLMTDMGVQADAENILVTNGSQQGLDLVGKLLLDRNDRILVESPGYLGGLKAFENYECTLVPVTVGEQGLDVASLSDQADRAKFLYTVPTFQNPTGSTLSMDNRREILNVASRRNFLIIEDGAYHFLRYNGSHIPPIKSIDDEDRVIYLGSLSKVLVPGIRVGWIVARRDVIEQLALLKQATDLAGNSFGQRFADLWLREIGLTPPVDLYRQKRDKAYEALSRIHGRGLSFRRPDGGFFIWLRLPGRLDAQAMLPLAKSHGVSFVPGAAFGGERNTMRFSFSQVGLEQIDEGVHRLERVLQITAGPHSGAAAGGGTIKA